jgi:hypothetical protein
MPKQLVNYSAHRLLCKKFSGVLTESYKINFVNRTTDSATVERLMA